MQRLTSVERRVLRYLISGMVITQEDDEWYGFSSPNHSASFHIRDIEKLIVTGRIIDNNGTLEITPAGEYHYKHQEELGDDLSEGEFE